MRCRLVWRRWALDHEVEEDLPHRDGFLQHFVDGFFGPVLEQSGPNVWSQFGDRSGPILGWTNVGRWWIGAWACFVGHYGLTRTRGALVLAAGPSAWRGRGLTGTSTFLGWHVVRFACRD